MADLFDEYPMLVFALESLVALALLVFIVLWTASGKKKQRQSPGKESSARADEPGQRR
jgi:hypothetical protein